MRRLKGYWECPMRYEECSECGELWMCHVYQGPMEEETGYRDEICLCEKCNEKMRNEEGV
jgi:hypothetical protein